MKTVTLTAVMAILVTIPLILGKKKVQPVTVKAHEGNTGQAEENLRYDIDDFIS